MLQVGDTLRVIEVFNKYLRQDEAGHDNGVVPSLVSYNLVRLLPALLVSDCGVYNVNTIALV